MKRLVHILIVGVLAAETLVLGQGGDATRILAAARAALGGPAIDSVKSLTAIGSLTRLAPGSIAEPTDWEMAMELPDKFVKKEVIAVMGDNTLSRAAGFNGDGLVEAIDAPPGMTGFGGGGGPTIMRAGPAAGGGASLTNIGSGAADPAAARKASVLANKQEFARFALGMFASSFAGYPLAITVDSPALSADGKADVLLVTGEGGFAAKLFIDRSSHLPVMLTWMAKEPMVRTIRSGGPGPSSAQSGGVTSFSSGSSSSSSVGGQTITNASGTAMTADQRDQMMKDMADQAAKAEAARKIVEFRLVYDHYKAANGTNLPTHLRRLVDGKPMDEIVLDKITLNPKIDAKKFETVK